MTVTVFSRKAMLSHLATNDLSGCAVIAFHDPATASRPMPPIDYSSTRARVFSLALHDLDRRALAAFHLTVESYFPKAPALARFIKDAVRDGLVLLCQCDYGESRSAAAAAAILEYYEKRGIDIFKDERYYPNQLIFNLLYEALTADETDGKRPNPEISLDKKHKTATM